MISIAHLHKIFTFFVLFTAFFALAPTSSFAIHNEGRAHTKWYEIGPLSYVYRQDAIDAGETKDKSIEYWVDNLFNRYWGLSEEGIQKFLADGSFNYGKDSPKSLKAVFPYLKYSNGKEVWWSWDQEYLDDPDEDDIQWHDTVNDLWWAPLIDAVVSVGQERDLFIYGDYVVGLDCGNITWPTRGGEKYPKIKGYKFNDINGNKQLDQEEPFLSGWKINLIDTKGKTLMSTTTDSSGEYEFDLTGYGELLTYPMTLKVEEELKDGWINTLSPAPLTVEKCDCTYRDKNFGNFKYVKIIGRKFEDKDGDGKRDSGDPFLNNWKIILKKSGVTVGISTTYTKKVEGSDDLLGYYEFDDLISGTYTIKEELKEGWMQTAPEEKRYTIVVESGKTYWGYNFGNFEKIKISGRKYEDEEGNGERNPGDTFLDNWRINLLKKEGGSYEPYKTTKTKEIDGKVGSYLFENLGTGTYKIEEELKNKWIQTEPTNPNYYIIKAKSGENSLGHNFGGNFFGNFETAAISGRKYEDENFDGNHDSKEPYLNGWKIILKKNGIKQTEAYTEEIGGKEGSYRFENLKPGTYTVEERLKDGWIQTDPKSEIYTIEVKSGVVYKDRDFGNFRLAKISGRKYDDTDGDGKRDTGEPYLNGWKIILKKDGKKQTEADTDKIGGKEGSYEFSGLTPGTYTIEEVLKSGWTRTQPTSGYYEIEIKKSGENHKDNDFGNFKKIKISGVKYEDLNGNGKQNFGEPYLKNWEIILTRPDGTTTSKHTSITGAYQFAGLGPGTYKVEEELKNGWVQTQPKNPNYYTVKAKSGQDSTGNDFGNYIPGKISGYKWDDKNEDGIWDKPDEKPLEGWQIKIKKQNSLFEESTYTNKNGFYQFKGLSPGKHTVKEVLKSGWVLTYPKDGLYKIDVISRTNSKDNNFGNFKLGIKAGQKWNDEDGDGIWDEDELPLSGWEIALLKVEPGREPTTVATDITDDSGWYRFDEIHYGNYLVREVLKEGWKQTHPAIEDENKKLIPIDYEIFVESGFLDEDNHFGNWHVGSFGKTKGFWMNWDNHFSLEEMQAFVSFVNENSTVYGDEEFGFGYLEVKDIYNKLNTKNSDDHLGGGTTELALMQMESQFLATWLNISAGFLDRDKIVYLNKIRDIKETEIDPVILFGAEKLSIGEIIFIVEEKVRQTKEHSTGWGHDEYQTAQEVFAAINEAYDTDGYIFRDYHVSSMQK